MKKEFKFVRGAYTDKKLFNDEIIQESLFILNKNGDEMGFEYKDDEFTQTILVKASDDNKVCKLYTITPEQITMKGNLEKGTEGSDYKFTPTVKENTGGEPIPLNVRTTAEKILEEKLNADYSALSKENIGIGEGSNPGPVEVTFTDNDEKSFKRNMIFRATGEVDKRSLISVGDVTGADLKDKEVYYLKDNNYERLSNINDTDIFHNGIKQEKVQVAEKIFPAYEIQLRKDNNVAIADNPAHQYIAPTDYKFNHNKKSNLTYTEILESEEQSFTLSPINSGQNALPNLTFTLPSDNNCLYSPNAKNKYIIKLNEFIKITDESDYPFNTEQPIYDNTNYYPYGGFAYKDSSTDTNIYKKLDNPTTKPINSNNVKMTDTHTPAPLFNLDKDHPYTITIKEDTFSITATEV